MGSAGNTGLAAGPIAAPPAATFGTAPKQTASSASPTFDGSSNGYPANVTFPLISASLKAASPGISAAAGDPAATLTVTTTSASTNNGTNATSFEISIPSLNISSTFTNRENIVQNIDGVTRGYSYVAVGEWAQSDNSRTLLNRTQFSFGYETPTSGMPASGTANFSGTADASVYKTIGSNILDTRIEGKADISVNFSSGQVAGGLSQMKQWDGVALNGPQGTLPWNDVSVSASIAAGTNSFSGNTAATSAPGTTFSLAGSATGKINGAFYGPTAGSLGAVWSLSDGTASALGTIVAKTPGSGAGAFDY
jgi:hypothetical protein